MTQAQCKYQEEIEYVVPESSIRPTTNNFDKVVTRTFATICFVMAIALAVIISMATVMRYVLEMDLYGYEEWIQIFAFWLYFIGAAYGAFAGTHVCADLVQSYVHPGFIKRLLLVVRDTITLGVTLLFTWYGWDFFYFGLRGPLGTGVAIPKTVAWRIPLWTGYLPIFIGLVFMSYYFTWDLIRSSKALVAGGKSE